MARFDWELIRRLMRNDRYGFNSEVKRHFANDPDSTARGRLKNMLLISPTDSRPIAESKIQFFRDQIQKVHNRPTVIGEFKTNLDAKIKYRCQVQLYFKQDDGATPPGKDPLDAQISFRLDETHKTITEARYKALANRIKAELSPNDGYRWNKGKYLCLYDDPELGYHFQVYAISKAEGIEVIKKVMSIQNHTYNDKLFRCTEPERNSDNTPGSELILGQTRELPRWRPTSNVRFQYADLIVWNVKEPITLVDMTGFKPNPILRGWV